MKIRFYCVNQYSYFKGLNPRKTDSGEFDLKRTYAAAILILILLVSSSMVVLYLSQELISTQPDEIEDELDVDFTEPYIFTLGSNFSSNYSIIVSFPVDYNHSDSIRYPVVYILDGNWYFHYVRGIIDYLIRLGDMPQVILVGIGYTGYRFDDFGHTFGDDAFFEQRYHDFHLRPATCYRFIGEVLIPHIDFKFNTDPHADRTLIGHSSAAHFAMYTLLKYPETPFRNFIAVSGDFSREGGIRYSQEEAMFNRLSPDNNLNISLHLSAGDEEELRFIDSVHNMTERLNSRNYTNFRLESEIYTNCDHSSVKGPAFKVGLRMMFRQD